MGTVTFCCTRTISISGKWNYLNVLKYPIICAKSTPFVVHADKLKKCFAPPVVNWLKDNVTDDTNESGASIVDRNRRNIETRIYDEVRHHRDSPCTTFHILSSDDPESTSSTAIPTCDICTSKRSRRAPAFPNDYVITAIHVC